MTFQEKFEFVTALVPLQYIVPDCDSHQRYSGFAEYRKPKVSAWLAPYPTTQCFSPHWVFWISFAFFLTTSFRIRGNTRKNLMFISLIMQENLQL